MYTYKLYANLYITRDISVWQLVSIDMWLSEPLNLVYLGYDWKVKCFDHTNLLPTLYQVHKITIKIKKQKDRRKLEKKYLGDCYDMYNCLTFEYSS